MTKAPQQLVLNEEDKMNSGLMKDLEALLIQASHLEYKYAWTDSRGDRDLISWHQIETEEKIKYCLTKLVAELLELKDHDLRHHMIVDTIQRCLKL
jgi:uncharacterized protein YdgA (DUF945 family)